MGGLIDEFITKVGAAIHGWFSSVFGFTWIPEVWYWYWWFFLLLAAASVIIFFFGWSKIVRMVVSFVVLGAGLFVAGGAYMVHRLKLRQQIADAKKKKIPPPKPKDDGGGFFGGWR